MERKDFLKGVSLAGVASVLPFKKAITALTDDGSSPLACTLTPTETEGPYPYPAGEINNPLVRSDVRETKTGILLTLTITVTNLSCTPVPGARVDIWHCDKDGYYSGYNGQMGYLGTQNNAGQTWFRGVQYTNAGGQVTFTTIYPGWYVGRTTHIHIEIFTGTTVQK